MERRYRLTIAAREVGLPVRQVRHYVSIGLLPATPVEQGDLLLDDVGLARLRKIHRLRSDVGLNTAGIEVALRLLDQIEELHAELERLRPPSASGMR
ncbi:MAG: chaperone modulator CbpM [Thermomicrobiales bacterium]